LAGSVHEEAASNGGAIALAFVGSVVPDRLPYWNDACSRAGNMFQERLLAALEQNGLPASLILSQQPLRAFPASRSLVVRGASLQLGSGLKAKRIPFVNVQVVRQLTVGLMVLTSLARWGRHQGGSTNKVVLTYNLTEPPALFTLLASRLIDARTVALVNDVFVPGETIANSWTRRLDFWLQQRLIRRFNGLSVANTKIIEDLAGGVPYIRNEGGVADAVASRFRAIAGRHAGETYRPLTIVFAGSLTELNGIAELIEAFSHLEGSGFRLIVAGRGPCEAMVRSASQADRRIEFYGYLSEDAVLDLYAEADVLVNLRITRRLKSHYFFPSKLIEYMATGVPVITTATGQVEEEFGGVVFLLKEESAEALASLLLDVAALDVETRWSLGANARAQVLRTHGWSVHGRRLSEFIQAIVAGK
jgi:glycosyltransferase involved in cell wall biosynthesis